jgi:SagB-type dehydrogenase family enzyme
MPKTVGEEQQIVRAYHERTKHKLTGFARGPETLDWSCPPVPSRSFPGAPRISLPLLGRGDLADLELGALRQISGSAMSLPKLAALLELSFGLTAWKEHGPDRWALRANPSSGNLHPTECYVIAIGIEDLAPGLYHYLPFDHALELRAEFEPPSPPNSVQRLWVLTSSIHWREAWKYGERALRYCLLDSGHALGSVAYAAQTLDLEFRPLPLASSALGELLGLNRAADFVGVEAEEPDWVGSIQSSSELGPHWPHLEATSWHGRASRIDPHPMYKWPEIEVAAEACRLPSVALPLPPTRRPPSQKRAESRGVATAQNIRKRRSAQAFHRTQVISTQDLLGLLQALVVDGRPPWPSWPHEVKVHPVLLVHRVSELTPGIYCLPRSTEGSVALQEGFDERFLWEAVSEFTSGMTLFRLATGQLGPEARRFCCGQAIAADAAFVVVLVAEFDSALGEGAFRYRHLHEEAGLLGHILYLEAEARGLRGTGIGCFFDDPLHEALGIQSSALQVVYCFAVGKPIVDTRIQTYLPYAERVNPESEDDEAAPERSTQ